jgi:hypothetical protein
MNEAISGAEKGGKDLWAITSYFNPAGWKRRLANYRLFHERLSVPLVAVELAYGANFELNESDADILVQLHGQSVMWQKERLLNVALQALPRSCRKVVWVDCDVLFGTDDWPEHLSRSLDNCIILQPFSHVHSLPPTGMTDDLRSCAADRHESVSSAIASGVSPAVCIGETISADGVYTYARGFTWAARRELLDEHGFYDSCIMGNGDRAMAGAIYGCYDAVMCFQRMNDRQRARYLGWARPFYETVGGATGSMNCHIYHLWHGQMRDRRYQERHEILPCFEFDPFEDIVVDGSGCWRWNTDKPQMHACVREYFASRKEDG